MEYPSLDPPPLHPWQEQRFFDRSFARPHLRHSHVVAPATAPAPAGGGTSLSGRRACASVAVSPGAATPRRQGSFAPPTPPGAIPVAVVGFAVVLAVAVAAAGGLEEEEEEEEEEKEEEEEDTGNLLPPGPNSVGIGSLVWSELERSVRPRST